MDCDPAWLLCPSDCPGKDAGASCHSVSPGDLPDPGIEPGSPALQADSLYRVSHQGSQHSTQDTFKSPFLSPPRVLHQEMCDSHVIVCSSLHMRGKDVPVENEANGKYCPGGGHSPAVAVDKKALQRDVGGARLQGVSSYKVLAILQF